MVLAACSSNGEGAGTAVEKYFQAIASGDEDRIATLSCPEWESSARADVAAFVGVKARLENVSCAPVSGSDPTGDEVVVECSGAIVATYNNEDTSFELKGKQLKVVQLGGEWLVCGYVP
jgi:hypothetical protein